VEDKTKYNIIYDKNNNNNNNNTIKYKKYTLDVIEIP